VSPDEKCSVCGGTGNHQGFGYGGTFNCPTLTQRMFDIESRLLILEKENLMLKVKTLTEKDLIDLIDKTQDNNYFSSDFSKLLDTKLLDKERLYFIFKYLISNRRELFTVCCSHFLPSIKGEWLQNMMNDEDEQNLIDWASLAYTNYQVPYNLFNLMYLGRPKLSKVASSLLFDAIIARHSEPNKAGIMTSGDWSVYRVFESYPEADIRHAFLAVKSIQSSMAYSSAMETFLAKYPEAKKFQILA
jgi:hypothetical protein